MTPLQNTADCGAPSRTPTEHPSQDQHHHRSQHHQSRHKHHRRTHQSTTALYRGSSGKGKQQDEHSGESSDGSFSESGSASCSTASDYSVEYADPGGSKHHHRHRHHRRSYTPGSTSHQNQPSSARRMSAQNLPILLRGTAGRRKQVFIDHPVASGDEDGNGSAGSESPEDDRRRRRSTTNESSESTDDNLIEDGDDGTNVRARQEALNTRHPFGLPIWKPALYKKSRSVTRAAFLALHARPLRSEKLYLKPGNIAWMLLAGWWLMAVCLVVAAILLVVPFGGRYYARVVAGLGWYLFWPFGRYVERIKDNAHQLNRCSMSTVSLADDGAPGTGDASTASVLRQANDGDDDEGDDGNEEAPLLSGRHLGSESVLSPRPGASTYHTRFRKQTVLGRAIYYIILTVVLNPILIIVSAASWFAVFSIPMGKLTHTLARYLWRDPLSLHFRSGDLPTVKVAAAQAADPDIALLVGGHGEPQPADSEHDSSAETAVIEQPAPTVLLCTNEAIGWYYYKYTVDGVNILFYNMLSVAVFVLVAAFVIAPLTSHQHFLVQPAVLFPLCLVSTIPLAYFIGQAVSSISAQSSLGMGAVINATFGSIIEVILYSIALTQGKARLVEGALIGSLLAGLMLMPGTSMIAGGIKHKVQRFNAKSAEVTATLVIMSIIGAFAPTLFYHTFAVPEFECEDEPVVGVGATRRCRRLSLDLLDDPFYQETVKPFMYFCTAILPLSYLIALWFSLKTHVKHIYSSGQTSNPIVRHVLELFRRTLGPDVVRQRLQRSSQIAGQGPAAEQPAHLEGVPAASGDSHADVTLEPHTVEEGGTLSSLISPSENTQSAPLSTVSPRKPPRISRSSSTIPPMQHHYQHHHHRHSVSHGGGNSVSAGHHPADAPSSLPNVPRLSELPRVLAADPDDQLPDLSLLDRVADGVGTGEGGGHDAPNWSKTKSAFILCSCTVLFSLIAEVLVDTVDVVIQGLGIKEKYIGLTLFALVPNVTEFLNAIAFAVQNNIALSIEISNAYTVQVVLLQIPILVFFSAFYGVPDFVTQLPNALLTKGGAAAAAGGGIRNAFARFMASPSAVRSLMSGSPAEGHLPTDPSAYVFALLFPLWDLIAALFCVFLLTYMLIEGKANYFKGSILCLSYCVWLVSFAYEPVTSSHGSD
ncbi:hypothetical protein EV178_001393 [Coemansia sp. RSA 1646]|nr:hypothetical protein EV178_001393 [Coemansia sp. RSA 1646]KAJ2093429.1 hypothetical protein IW138_000279 [Coemansia sp. RSA 986]